MGSLRAHVTLPNDLLKGGQTTILATPTELLEFHGLGRLGGGQHDYGACSCMLPGLLSYQVSLRT
jgi:hypothetical protein